MSIYPASIDDNDPAFIYSPGWELITKDGSWTGTMHSTDKTGAFARVRFTGSIVAVICTIPTGDGRHVSANFTIDNDPPIFVSHASTPPVQFEKIFWDSGPLPIGNHLLTITHAGPGMYLRVDRVDYDPTDSHVPRVDPPAPQDPVSAPAVTSTGTSIVGNTTPVVALPRISITASSTNSQAATTADSAECLYVGTNYFGHCITISCQSNKYHGHLEHRKSDCGACGAAAILAVLAIVLVILLRRRRKRRNATGLADETVSSEEPLPIVSSAASATSSSSNRDIKNSLGPFDNTQTKSTSRSGSPTNPPVLSYAASPSTHHVASNSESSAQIRSPIYAVSDHQDPFLESPPAYQAHLRASNMPFTPRR
ncbi:hypothetical protein NLJ89_g7387 [Agrocybe chaxingu]|uniref:Uncharacterized protein n=1 Tax=Agrocybe chaxingu TaxID=84603 RepID=A0A9W8K4K2_9AGAR|nr:hypothetical protein NLJ89_g7387 [Agrocybe chaxingu]